MGTPQQQLAARGLDGWTVRRERPNVVALDPQKRRMVKIYSDGERAARDRELLDLLHSAGVPVRPVLTWMDAFTCVCRVEANDHAVDGQQLGPALTLLHAVEHDPGRSWDTLIASALSDLAGHASPLAARARAHLASCYEQFMALAREHQADWALIHGDLTRSNMLSGERLLLIDFELARRGPREWDFASLIFSCDRLGELAPQVLADTRSSYGSSLDERLLGASLRLWEARYATWTLRRADVPAETAERFIEDAIAGRAGLWDALVKLEAPFASGSS